MFTQQHYREAAEQLAREPNERKRKVVCNFLVKMFKVRSKFKEELFRRVANCPEKRGSKPCNQTSEKPETAQLNGCDGGHETYKEIRVIPIGGSGNILVCHDHYLVEMLFRKKRNEDLHPNCRFDIPNWEDLEVSQTGC